MVALDGHDWGSPPIRGIGKLGSALDATVGSGVLQGSGGTRLPRFWPVLHWWHQTEEPGFPLLQPGPGMAQAACSNPSTMGIAISRSTFGRRQRLDRK